MVWKKEDDTSATSNMEDPSLDSGLTRLQELGYKQELKRDLS